MTDIIAHLRSATNADPQAEIDRLRQQVKVDGFCGKLKLPGPKGEAA
jgi:hypothetical protein